MMRLPKPAETNVTYERRYIGSVYTAEQMRKYAAKAVAAEREACAKVCEDLHPGLATRVAAEHIRSRKWL
jgi:hypothetical protein